VLKALGVSRILAVVSQGSSTERHQPGDAVVDARVFPESEGGDTVEVDLSTGNSIS